MHLIAYENWKQIFAKNNDHIDKKTIVAIKSNICIKKNYIENQKR